MYFFVRDETVISNKPPDTPQEVFPETGELEKGSRLSEFTIYTKGPF